MLQPVIMGPPACTSGGAARYGGAWGFGVFVGVPVTAAVAALGCAGGAPRHPGPQAVLGNAPPPGSGHSVALEPAQRVRTAAA